MCTLFKQVSTATFINLPFSISPLLKLFKHNIFKYTNLRPSLFPGQKAKLYLRLMSCRHTRLYYEHSFHIKALQRVNFCLPVIGMSLCDPGGFCFWTSLTPNFNVGKDCKSNCVYLKSPLTLNHPSREARIVDLPSGRMLFPGTLAPN